MNPFSWPNGTLLGGIVGSTAYGLKQAGSDVDRLGVRAATWAELTGLHPPTGKNGSSWTSKDPDGAVHEALKFCHLALGCNPTVLEIMWLPPNLVEVQHPLGTSLVEIREKFLSRQGVRNAYLGYATQQFKQLGARGSFSSTLRNRTEKHARHLLRLLTQGTRLYVTGTLELLVQSPETYFDFGRKVAAGDLDLAQRELAAAERIFDKAVSPLAEQPDQEVVEEWLRKARTWAAYGMIR
jgi:predicted nucleotidyltransferase